MHKQWRRQLPRGNAKQCKRPEIPPAHTGPLWQIMKDWLTLPEGYLCPLRGPPSDRKLHSREPCALVHNQTAPLTSRNGVSFPFFRIRCIQKDRDTLFFFGVGGYIVATLRDTLWLCCSCFWKTLMRHRKKIIGRQWIQPRTKLGYILSQRMELSPGGAWGGRGYRKLAGNPPQMQHPPLPVCSLQSAVNQISSLLRSLSLQRALIYINFHRPTREQPTNVSGAFQKRHLVVHLSLVLFWRIFQARM